MAHQIYQRPPWVAVLWIKKRRILSNVCIKERKKASNHQARVSYIDNSISLNVVHVRVAKAQLSASSLSGADDPGGYCVLERKRAANGDHKLARSQVWRAPQQQNRKLCLRARRTQRRVYISRQSLRRQRWIRDDLQAKKPKTENTSLQVKKKSHFNRQDGTIGDQQFFHRLEGRSASDLTRKRQQFSLFISKTNLVLIHLHSS